MIFSFALSEQSKDRDRKNIRIAKIPGHERQTLETHYAGGISQKNMLRKMHNSSKKMVRILLC